MKDGYHQVPLRKEDRHITCMTTPRGTKQWTVLVMGLKNGGAIFQRMMEWVLRGVESASVYIDDVIVGSTGETPEEMVENHERDLREVLERLREHEIIVGQKSIRLFATEVEFCGHILKDGRREPAPGKLLSIQKWELPKTVTQLRGFLGLTNYYSSYVPHYAEYAGPLTSKLQLNRVDGKKGSRMVLKWQNKEIEAFEALKTLLAQRLELFWVNPDQPFVLKTDASGKAVGAVLEQEREVEPGKKVWVPVGFFSRKLVKGQLNWTPREKETYAVVSALRKWAGWIGLQKVTVRTDHKSLENWVTEKMDTPSGPAGRRARWHEIFSKFDLEVEYMPGKDNIVADAMSRFAYPACKAFQDTSIHGDEESRREMEELIREERMEEREEGSWQVTPVMTRGMKKEAERVGRPLRADAPPFVPQMPPEIDEYGNERRGNGRQRDQDGPISLHDEEEGLHDQLGCNADYAGSQQWGEAWASMHSGDHELPQGMQLQGGKMIFGGKVCVPERKEWEVVKAYHGHMGHVGVKKTFKEIERRFIFPTSVKLYELVGEVRRMCVTCQVCDPPNWNTSLPITHNVVPGRVMSSVAMDVFYIPPAKWKGVDYDSLLLCVDRRSGWVIARPCQKVGLTAEKAAHLMMENGWETFGVPSVITSDRGSQFVGQWWKTMCARLGIRQAFSQAYRPQANGRAEVAGKSLIGFLRKLWVEERINWVEALPRVLRINHDLPGESG